MEHLFYYTFCMSIWKMLKDLVTYSQRRKKYFNVLDKNLDFEIYSVALTPDERHQFWNQLSSREKDVTALTCLRYTNLQIAGRLDISIETVRTYLKRVLNKSGFKNKADLRVFFADWDFSAWERRKDPYR